MLELYLLLLLQLVVACIETFAAVVLGPSSLFPSLLSLSQNLSLPFLSDTQWFLIHLPFFLGLLHHLLLFFSMFSMESFLISSALFLSLVLLLSPCSPLSPDSRSLSSNLSIICSSSLSISDISGEIPLARSSIVIFFLYFLERRACRSLTALFWPSWCAKASLAFKRSVMSSQIFPPSLVETLY